MEGKMLDDPWRRKSVRAAQESHLNFESNEACGHPAKALAATIPDGNPAALDQLFASWMPRLYRTATHILRNPEDSEDAMQDALLSAFQNLSQFEGRAKFTTWMYSILLNAVRAKLRKRKSQPETCPIDPESSEEDFQRFAVTLVDTSYDPEQECAREEKGRILAKWFRELPSAYQAVVWLCDIQELRQKDAARQLGLPLGTLKCQLHRAHRLFSERARRTCPSPSRPILHLHGRRCPAQSISPPASSP